MLETKVFGAGFHKGPGLVSFSFFLKITKVLLQCSNLQSFVSVFRLSPWNTKEDLVCDPRFAVESCRVKQETLHL